MGVYFKTLNMKVLSVLCLVFSVAIATAYEEWTCEECAEMSAFMTLISSDPVYIEKWNALLVADICPLTSVPDTCPYTLPMLWTVMAPELFNAFFQFICVDLTECPFPPTKFTGEVSVPSCADCEQRLNETTDLMYEPSFIDSFIIMFGFGTWCSDHWPDHVQLCKDGVVELVPLILLYIADSPRDWITQSCLAWGC